MTRWRFLMPWRLLLAAMLAWAALPIPAPPAFGSPAAQAAGATLTVLRGTAAVLQSDGTPYSPAPSGLALGAGDQVSALAASSALITFFEGSEVELQAGATVIIRELAQQGSRNNIRLESVVGAAVHRVISLTDPGSSYRVDGGGTVPRSAAPSSPPTPTPSPMSSPLRSRRAA